MAALADDVKAFIVQRLACYDTPQQVADAVKDEFGVEIVRQQVQSYDPERAGKKPAEKWCALFDATRTKFLDAVDTIPIAQKSVRLRRLERMAHAAEKRGNYPLAATLLEQAAKELGGLYTNRREHAGPGGHAIQMEVTVTRRIVRPEPATP